MLSCFDAHCDTLTTGDLYHHLNLANEPFLRRGQIFAVCAEGALQRDLTFFNRAVSRLADLPVVLCRSSAELTAAIDQGKTAAILGIEGGECVGCDVGLLREAYARGARVLGLTHNRFNGLTGSCREECGMGLTDRGRVFAAEVVRLGMILDLSHISDRGAEELLSMPDAAVIASHSNARAVCGHARNLSDRLFVRLAERGGLCGLNLYAPFLAENGNASLEDVCAHVAHFLGLTPAAEDSLCLGADFDGCDQLPEGISTSADLSWLYELFLRKNYSETFVKKLFFENLCAYLRRTL
ncbi:MAG: membrane dipeptidase [Ruminococcaceae bacterium]|nr:membrane dipeptidase [Oscillospiraceae bacterium]